MAGLKKTMLPILAIAFVVAIVSTFVFYGLFAGKLRSDTLAAEHPSGAIRSTQEFPQNGQIPKGMRAISIRVSESAAVASLIHPGSRVDLQAVTGLHADAQLVTILQDVEVLDSSAAKAANEFVVSILLAPENANLAALADTGGRIRVSLRNPGDRVGIPATPMAFNGMFKLAAPTRPNLESRGR